MIDQDYKTNRLKQLLCIEIYYLFDVKPNRLLKKLQLFYVSLFQDIDVIRR